MLNRRTFIQGLSEIKDFPVALTQAITFGPNDFSGPSTYRVVMPIANVQTADGNRCPKRRQSWDDTPGDPKIPITYEMAVKDVEILGTPAAK